MTHAIKYDVDFMVDGTLYRVTVTTAKRSDAIRRATADLKRHLGLDYVDFVGSSVR